jgi:uncharacterized protein
MSTPEFSFPVNELDAGGKQFRLPVRAAWLRRALEGTDVGAAQRDGELDLRLSRSGPDVVVRGTLSADVTVPCSRCLEPTVVSVREELSTLAVPKGTAGVSQAPRGRQDADKKDKKARETTDLDDDDESPEEADVLVYEGDQLVLDDLVRDELLLGIPMIPLCSEACPGISPEVSVTEEAGIDPRLVPLLKLKNKT